MADTKPIEVIKVAFRQDKAGDIISLRMHSDDRDNAIARAPLGARFACAFVQIGDDEQPVEKKPPNALVQRAVILCANEEFHRFLADEYAAEWELFSGALPPARAACVMRALCGIESRSELAANLEAGIKFRALLVNFEIWKRQQ